MSAPLVGLVDQTISGSDVISWDVNRIGGLPVWLNHPPANGTLTCRACGQGLTLMTQLYCPLGSSAYHRCLYIFVCLNHSCQHHCRVRVFRCLKFDSSYNKGGITKSENASQSLNSDMWADDQDDWGDDGEDWGDDETDQWNVEETKSMNDVDAHRKGMEMNPGSAFESVSTVQVLRCVPDPSINLELPDAVSQMTISDHDMTTPHSVPVQEVHLPDASGIIPPSGSCGDGDGVIGEEIGPQSDRYEHLATILNTKFNHQQENQGSSSQPSNDGRAVPAFEQYYLYVIEEPQSKDDKLTEHVATLIKEYEKCEGKQIETLMTEGAKSKGKGSKELYEKSELKHGDRIFHKFLKRLQMCPDQCIRYDRGGDPILALEMKAEKSVINPCPLCCGPRIYELQLLPALIPCLILKGSSSPIEFSTILIFTCRDNCAPGDLVEDLMEEVAIFQEDPDQHLYR